MISALTKRTHEQINAEVFERKDNREALALES